MSGRAATHRQAAMAAGRRVRLGALIGTFDPVHHVHLLMAREASRALALDSVLFVPVGIPSHRDPALVSPALDRCAMVALALTAEHRFALSTVDADRPRPTYTIDTLRDLRGRFGSSADLFVIIGADNLIGLPGWRESAELFRLADFVGSSRRGYPLVDPGLPPGRLTLLRIRHLDISGTRIRNLVRSGRSISDLTPRPVARYIEERRLYRTAARGIA
jgi:nicotinate-nucleotide adenylyltransferase